MEAVVFDDVTVDRCTSCKGIWFDANEQKVLKSRKGGDAIDTGDAAIGKRWDKVTDIQCPRCNVPMIRMVEADEQPIDYEACTKCFGIFLDAGEFRHLKDGSMSDYLRGLFGASSRRGAWPRDENPV